MTLALESSSSKYIENIDKRIDYISVVDALVCWLRVFIVYEVGPLKKTRGIKGPDD